MEYSVPVWDRLRQGARVTLFAVISDIHSNVEALEAVLKDIDRRGLKKIVCLGDVIGYGASPQESLDLVVERCEVTLCGNHDHAVFYEPYNFKGRLDDYPLTMAYGKQMDALRTELRDIFWDGEFRHTVAPASLVTAGRITRTPCS